MYTYFLKGNRLIIPTQSSRIANLSYRQTHLILILVTYIIPSVTYFVFVIKMDSFQKYMCEGVGVVKLQTPLYHNIM